MSVSACIQVCYLAITETSRLHLQRTDGLLHRWITDYSECRLPPVKTERRVTFLVDLYKHFYAVYLFGGQVGKKFFNQFGAQRQESEKKAVNIALQNLARNSGYGDVTRLTWSMETELIKEDRKSVV